MNELELINIIKTHTGCEFIGDDCAYLNEFNIVISQDNLVENIHFKRNWCTPYQLGYKAVTVNISDILASGAKPEYITIGLSLPNNITSSFVDEFYKGTSAALYGAKIVGGDITGSKTDIIISISAIGSTLNRKISSRANAKQGYSVVTHGIYGASALGLMALQDNKKNEFIKYHLEPKLNPLFSKVISENIKEDYAMMDTSDGLLDCLFKIAEASNVKISVDYNLIPRPQAASREQILFGGEDYNLVAVIPNKYISSIPDAVVIGTVEKYDGVYVDISGEKFKQYEQIKVYNHFGE